MCYDTLYFNMSAPVPSRRIKTEEKAKVVAAVWGPEFIQFVAVLAIVH